MKTTKEYKQETDHLLKNIDRMIYEIRHQSTRKERASSLKRYLVTDLEIIDRLSKETQKIIHEHLKQ
jgi:hypothetical protein